jgi:hypothetical protein
MELKSCPFCGSNKLEYSIKTTSSLKKVGYNCCIYCKNCNTYGPRVRSEKVDNRDYRGRYQIETDTYVKEEAIKKWNERVEGRL